MTKAVLTTLLSF